VTEFHFPISGDDYGSGHYGAGDMTNMLLHNVHELSVTLEPDELNKLLQHDSKIGALLTEQEPWENGEYIISFHILHVWGN
jgi:hypothetical protein